MKAILMTSAGNPDVLALRDIEKPELPSPHHLRVKLATAGVNPLDTKLRAKPIYYPDRLPTILGCDGAGIVEKTGSAVTRFKVGDAVFFNNGGIGDEPGCYAEYTTLHEEYCAASPANLGLQDSAALPLVLLTAWEAMVERADLQAGQTILIHAAAGGVGHISRCSLPIISARTSPSRSAMIKKPGWRRVSARKKSYVTKSRISCKTWWNGPEAKAWTWCSTQWAARLFCAH